MQLASPRVPLRLQALFEKRRCIGMQIPSETVEDNCQMRLT